MIVHIERVPARRITLHVKHPEHWKITIWQPGRETYVTYELTRPLADAVALIALREAGIRELSTAQ